MKQGQKQRAVIILKQKKFVEKEIEKASGAQMMLEQTLSSIESAQADVEVYKALKAGDAVLKDLQAKVSIDDWEELYADHKENLRMRDMEVEMFGQELNQAELLDELEELEAAQAAKELGDLEPLAIKTPPKVEVEEQEEPVQVKPQKKLVAA